ncbi:hypothetical protein RRG08_030172 [Elysia crispata]|uniref:Uncharacterized protein n=1 Tax=Elysia crispata TaxID=231223 RepID=A0AAE1DLD1_9GAST|nr:hypothetical protein RRG08_030172 [Elysia crispata]
MRSSYPQVCIIRRFGHSLAPVTRKFALSEGSSILSLQLPASLHYQKVRAFSRSSYPQVCIIRRFGHSLAPVTRKFALSEGSSILLLPLAETAAYLEPLDPPTPRLISPDGPTVFRNQDFCGESNAQLTKLLLLPLILKALWIFGFSLEAALLTVAGSVTGWVACVARTHEWEARAAFLLNIKFRRAWVSNPCEYERCVAGELTLSSLEAVHGRRRTETGGHGR